MVKTKLPPRSDDTTTLSYGMEAGSPASTFVRYEQRDQRVRGRVLTGAIRRRPSYAEAGVSA